MTKPRREELTKGYDRCADGLTVETTAWEGEGGER